MAHPADIPDIVIRTAEDKQREEDAADDLKRSLIEREIGGTVYLDVHSAWPQDGSVGVVWNCLTYASARAWAAVLAREFVREEGKRVIGSAFSLLPGVSDSRVYPPRAENSLLEW